MAETIAAIDTIALRIPLDVWAPAPMSHGVPRTHVESLYVRVTTSGGVVRWGESFDPKKGQFDFYLFSGLPIHRSVATPDRWCPGRVFFLSSRVCGGLLR